MKPDDILKHSPKILTQEQREFYFENGYLQLEGFVSEEWLDRLWKVTNKYIDDSRALDASDQVFDLEPNHTAENPRLRRITHPVEIDPVV